MHLRNVLSWIDFEWKICIWMDRGGNLCNLWNLALGLQAWSKTMAALTSLARSMNATGLVLLYEFKLRQTSTRSRQAADARQTRAADTRQTVCPARWGAKRTRESTDKKEKLSKITYNLQQSSSRNSNTPKSLVQDGSFQTLIWMCLEGKFQPRDYIKSNFLWLPLVSAAQLDYKGELITRLQKTNSLSPKKCFMWFKCWYDNQELCGSPNLKTITGKKQGREFIGCPAWQTPFVWSQAAAADT